ncbi:MAG TPA: gliding motility-associated C-terminal domain-containing protein [Bacteroidia bacterium]|nr:gliding motility-associated C-terminal domain-containing protein [Bacteroidia bacterium]
MKRILFVIVSMILAYQMKSQCFEIQSILVDACAGSQEGQNEMVTFQVGSSPLSTANLSVNWPNNSWLGLTKNAGTAADIATVNATILGCGFLKEPTAGFLPANSKVLLITSTAWTPLAQSFVNLTDTLYVIFQTAGNTAGHFANYQAGGGLRTLTMSFSSPPSCNDAVTYDRALLTNQAGNVGAQDGGAVEFTPSGVPTYVNHGCQAPFIPLSVDAGVNKTICAGTSQSFSATVTGAFTSVNWSLGTGASGTFTPTNSLTTVYTPGVGESGTVKLYCNVLKACGSQTTTVKDSLNLTITPLPTVTVSQSSVSICPGQSATVQANVNTPVTYSWSTGVITSSVSLNTVGVYTVNVSNACGVASSTVDVSLLSSPTLTATSSSNSICASGQTATLSLSGSVGNYIWSDGSNSSNLIINTPGIYTATVNTSSCGSATTSISIGTSPLPTVSIAVPSTSLCSGSAVTFTANSSEGNYLWTGGATSQTLSVSSASIVVTTTNVCGTALASQTLNIIPIPTVTVDNSNVILCSGQSATIIATSNGSSYNWNPGSIASNSIVVNSLGVYSVTASNACGNAIATSTVTVGALPTVTASASQTLICSGQNSLLSLAGSTGNYLWSNGATTNTTSVSTPGLYTVTVTTTCGQAVSSISVSSIPSASVTISASSSTICSGQSTTLTAQSNASNYSWSNGGTTSTQTINTPGIITVSVSNTCGVATGTIEIFSNTLPTINLTSSSATICPNETATLTVTGGSAPYSWSNSSNTGSVVTTTSAGLVTVSSTNVCGTSSDSVVITVVNINANISANPTGGVLPVVVSFTNNSVGANTYVWNFGNGNSANTSTVGSQTYNSAGTYTVYLTASNGSCSDIDYVVITVLNEESTLYVPNAFTPNGDSINDIFLVGATNIKEFNIMIFDRWGLKMFESSDILKGWDGKVNGKEVADGTYFHLIVAKDIDNREIRKQGTITLFK